MSNEIISSSVVIGDRDFGVVQQLWRTERWGVIEQFGVRWPTLTAHGHQASTYTAYGTLAEARECWHRNTQRMMGTGGEARCGDIMRFYADGQPSRRLCGECCQPEPRCPDGCGSLLETWR